MRLLTLVAIIAVFGIMVINGLSGKSLEIVHAAGKAANVANARQLRLALELYYADNGIYPAVQNGQQLVDLLYGEKYIGNLPSEATAFSYAQLANGQDYELLLR